VNSLMMHHLPEDVLQVPALPEMRRVLHPGGTPLVAEAQLPAMVLVGASSPNFTASIGWRTLCLSWRRWPKGPYSARVSAFGSGQRGAPKGIRTPDLRLERALPPG